MHSAAQYNGVRSSELADAHPVVQALLRRGLLYLEVPVRPEDHLSVPPLEVRARVRGGREGEGGGRGVEGRRHQRGCMGTRFRRRGGGNSNAQCLLV